MAAKNQAEATEEISVDEEMTAAELAAKTATPEPAGGAHWLILHEGVGRYVKDEVVPAHAFDGVEAERLVGLSAIVGTWRDATRGVADALPPLVIVRARPA